MPMGIPAAMLISSIVGAGASVAGSALSGRGKTSTATSGPTYTPQMQALMDELLGYSSGLRKNPQAGLAPMRRASMDQINRNYAGSADRVQTQLSKRGLGGSGKLPSTLASLEGSRLSSLGDLEGTFGQMALDQEHYGASLGSQLLGMGTGRESTQTQPENMAANGLMSAGNGLQNLSSLAMLAKLLKQ